MKKRSAAFFQGSSQMKLTFSSSIENRNKKSEVFASNYIKDTALSFREMNVLKRYVKQSV